MALDREGIVDAVYFGHGTPSGGILPDYFKGYYVPREFYNVEKAKRIMEELGYRQSNPLEFELMYRAEPDYAEMATIVQAIWYQIHVDVTLRPIKASGLLPIILGDDPPYTAVCMRITGGPFPYDHVFRMYSRDSYLNTVGYNKKGGVQNPRLEELLNQSVGEVDEEKAKAIYREISDIIFLEDVPVAPIAIPSNVDITYDYVRGWVPDMADYRAKTNVWISKKP
jgi:ABC-type transport system substrate-binding protein